MQDADHDHALGAAVETAVHCGRDLVPAVQHASVRKDDDAPGSERRREVPLAPALQPFERPALSQLVVLGAIELVDLLLELLAVESHSVDSRTSRATSLAGIRMPPRFFSASRTARTSPLLTAR